MAQKPSPLSALAGTISVPFVRLSGTDQRLDSSPNGVRAFLHRRGTGAAADRLFGTAMLLCALSVLLVVLLLFGMLFHQSVLSRHAFGWRFFIQSDWDPVADRYGALPFLYGTLVSSFLALCFSVPLALCLAVFLMEICPPRLRAPIGYLTDLLAAIPSVVYGFWALVTLVPLVRDHVGPLLARTMGWTGLFSGYNFGEGVLTASLVLSVMILPVISSITREVMGAVPVSQKEAALALGATRGEVIRIAVLRNARFGITGAVILGLGRALGETMAVTMVIGNHAAISRSLFAPGYTLASVIANEFTEAVGAMNLSALMEIGLALFLVTIAVNTVARLLVWAVTRGVPAGSR